METDVVLDEIRFDKSVIETVRRLHNEAFVWLCDFEHKKSDDLFKKSMSDFEFFKKIGNSGRTIMCFNESKEYREKFLTFCGFHELIKRLSKK